MEPGCASIKRCFDMNEQLPKEELRCEECDRPVIVERGLIDPPHVICTDCEEKINTAFWEALHE